MPEGADPANVLKGSQENARVEITGDWRTREKEGKTIEVITATKSRMTAGGYRLVSNFSRMAWISTESHPGDSDCIGKYLFAPIRTTSPGLTVYKGRVYSAFRLY